MNFTDLINGSETNHKYATRLLEDNRILELYEFVFNENAHARKLCDLIIPASTYEIRISDKTAELLWHNAYTSTRKTLARKTLTHT